MKGAAFLVTEVFEKIFKGILMEQGKYSPRKLEIARQIFVGLFSKDLNAVKDFNVPREIEQAGKERSWFVVKLTPEKMAFKLAFDEVTYQFTAIKELMETEGEAKKFFKAIAEAHQRLEEQRRLGQLLEKYGYLRKNISLN